MPIPSNFQKIMLPFLKALSDGENHQANDVIAKLADEFGLSEEEKLRRYPTGSAVIFANKARFARLSLVKAGLVEIPVTGQVKITDDGLRVLSQNQKDIDKRYLEQFPKFIEFQEMMSNNHRRQRVSVTVTEKAETEEAELESDPQDLMESAYNSNKINLAEEILKKIKESSPQFFENLVVDLMLKMGYGGSRHDAGEAVGKSGDGGIDGIIKEDRLGLDVIYLQAKRWSDNSVGSPEIQKFVGALADKHANKGVFITTSTFSREAREYAKRISNKVVLIDGVTLTELMIEYNLGVFPVMNYELKKIDIDYFSEN